MSEAPVLPKYYQVEQALRRRLTSLEPGASLPSEPELARELSVSRETVRSAISVLAREGLVHRVQGRGTFAARSKLEFPLGYHERSGDPQPDELPTHTVLVFKTIAAGERWSAVFGVSEREPILEVTRATSFAETPMGIGSMYVRKELAPGLRRRDFERGRFFYTLTDHGVAIARYRMVIESVVISSELAVQAGLRPGLPGLGVTRTAYGSDGAALAVVEIITRGDMAQYSMEFEADAVTETHSTGL